MGDPGLFVNHHVVDYLGYLDVSEGVSPQHRQASLDDLWYFYAFVELKYGIAPGSDPRSLSPDHVKAFFQHMLEGKGVSSQLAARRLNTVCSFMRFVQEQGK